MTETLPKRVGIVFSGGPAPGANAVISAAATAFRRSGIEVIGFLHGYSALIEFDGDKRPLVAGKDFVVFQARDLQGLRNDRGIVIGTARANPGKLVKSRADLASPEKTAPLRRVVRGLQALGVEALISIGGDDTLKTANFLHELQIVQPEGDKVRVVHVPKTIDNDYRGTDDALRATDRVREPRRPMTTGRARSVPSPGRRSAARTPSARGGGSCGLATARSAVAR